MNAAPIPDDLKRFILLGIPSIPYLEAMLLLRSETAQPWDARQVAQRLYQNEKVAQALLAELHAGGVIEADDEQAQQFRYSPHSKDLRQMIDRLAEVYAKNLIGVTNLVHSSNNKRKAPTFANAFIWRKDL